MFCVYAASTILSAAFGRENRCSTSAVVISSHAVSRHGAIATATARSGFKGHSEASTIRRAVDLRSWSAATDLVRTWEAAGEIGVVKKSDIPTIAEALDTYLADARAQQLSGETIRKYENLLLRRFLPWCESKGFRYLKQLGVEEMRQFRATWTDSALYASKNLERLRSFFRFCMHDEWVARNPAKSVKAPKVADKPHSRRKRSSRSSRRVNDTPGSRITPEGVRAVDAVIRAANRRHDRAEQGAPAGQTSCCSTPRTGTGSPSPRVACISASRDETRAVTRAW